MLVNWFRYHREAASPRPLTEAVRDAVRGSIANAPLSAWALFLTLLLCGLSGFVMLTTACLLALLRGRS